MTTTTEATWCGRKNNATENLLIDQKLGWEDGIILLFTATYIGISRRVKVMQI